MNRLVPLVALAALVACDERYSVGGTVSGLTDSVQLLNSSGERILVSADGAFAFDHELEDGEAYAVSVYAQPATQTCTVNGGSGVVDGLDVRSIRVVCSAATYTVGGTVTGLDGTLVLTNNGADALTVTADGAFFFQTALAAGASYDVAVQTQPAGQVCTVQNPTGTGRTNTVAVVCATTTYAIGGTLAGLSGTLVLQNNLTDDLTLTTDGAFVFATAVADGSRYSVSVLTQPAGQVCTVDNAEGDATADVSDVVVTCSADTVQVGGSITGLAGAVVIVNNGGDPQTITTDGAFAFTVLRSATYAITIQTQPASQTCVVTNGTGTAEADVTNVAITCSVNTYTVGGTITGLGAGIVTLQNNGADNLTQLADGPFTFATPVATGATYNVTVLSQPLGRTCITSNASGLIADGNVTNVQVTCVPD